jgi:hypothetical protein
MNAPVGEVIRSVGAGCAGVRPNDFDIVFSRLSSNTLIVHPQVFDRVISRLRSTTLIVVWRP